MCHTLEHTHIHALNACAPICRQAPQERMLNVLIFSIFISFIFQLKSSVSRRPNGLIKFKCENGYLFSAQRDSHPISALAMSSEQCVQMNLEVFEWEIGRRIAYGNMRARRLRASLQVYTI